MNTDDNMTLTREEILKLFAGRDAWHFEGVERLGIPPIQVADCGHGLTLVAPPFGSATCFPTSIGMAATWNRDLLFEVGQVLGREARAKDCGVLLGPMVNLHRIPAGGRNYETFSEDPVLTARLAAQLVKGLQSEGTGGCVKSFACNNQQKDQKNTSSEVDSRTLREIYLKVYQLIFEEVEPWTLMTSYNPINGVHPSDSPYWLGEVVREELGFSGVIISDWHAVQGETALTSGLDIEMPGPGKVLIPEVIQAAIDRGELTWEELEERARRILRMHEKARPAREGDPRFSAPELDSGRHREVARRVAEESIVLLKNEGDLLPLDRGSLKRIAVIGPNAATARLGGGGSASVHPFFAASPLEGIKALVPDSVEVVYAEGCPLGDGVPAIPQEAFSPGTNGAIGQGLTGEYFTVEDFDSGRGPVVTQVDPFINFSWGWASPATGLPRGDYAIRWTGQLRSPVTGKVTLSLSARESIARVKIGDRVLLDCWTEYDPSNFEDRYRNRHGTAELEMQAGQPVDILVEMKKVGTKAALTLGWELPGQKDSIEEAADHAASADVVIVVGGLSNIFEGGTCDREAFELPGRQEELIKAVAKANPNTVVVLNNGTPVSFEGWKDKVRSILEAFYPGQDGGTALARILFGEVNPSGKLPDTFPKSWEDVAAMRFYPGADGKVQFGEKLMVGYRHFDRNGIEPSFPFGFGLSYTRFHYSKPVSSAGRIPRGGSVDISVEVSNSGKVFGRECIQLYMEPVEAPEDRPVRTLIDFKKVELEPGDSVRVVFTIRYKDLLGFHPGTGKWELISQFCRLRCGPHSRAGDVVLLECGEAD